MNVFFYGTSFRYFSWAVENIYFILFIVNVEKNQHFAISKTSIVKLVIIKGQTVK